MTWQQPRPWAGPLGLNCKLSKLRKKILILFSKSLATQSSVVWTKYQTLPTWDCLFFRLGFWNLCLLIVNSLLTWSDTRGRNLTSKKQEKAAAVKKILDWLTHHGNYSYARVFFPAVDAHGQRFKAVKSSFKLHMQRFGDSVMNAVFQPFFPVWHVENVMLNCEYLFCFENCNSLDLKAYHILTHCLQLNIIFCHYYLLFQCHIPMLYNVNKTFIEKV